MTNMVKANVFYRQISMFLNETFKVILVALRAGMKADIHRVMIV